MGKEEIWYKLNIDHFDWTQKYEKVASLDEFKKNIIYNLGEWFDYFLSTKLLEAVRNKEEWIIQDLQFKYAGEDKETNRTIYMVLARFLHLEDMKVIGKVDGLFDWVSDIKEDLIAVFLSKKDLNNLIQWTQNLDKEKAKELEEKWLAEYSFEYQKYVWDSSKLRSMSNEELLQLYNDIDQYK